VIASLYCCVNFFLRLQSAMHIKNGSLFLFRLFGVNVFVHWSWLLIAVVQIFLSRNDKGIITRLQHPIGFHIALYLCLFLIVLIHEFGHALACKSVGGKADQIFLWPLGGIAYVQPPQRPGALLWSIAAGPLVNVILLPLTIVPGIYIAAVAPPGAAAPDFLISLAVINAILLIFNMLPFYPLDGGQILRSLIWFVAGRGLSLFIASIIGIVGAALLALAALLVTQSVWLAIVGVFMAVQSYQGLRFGYAQYKMESGPRHDHASCPFCHQHPPQSPLWSCPCGSRFDTFQTGGNCPACGRAFQTTMCPFCQQSSPIHLWFPQNAAFSNPPAAFSAPWPPPPAPPTV
jgi:Zn-dependent protease